MSRTTLNLPDEARCPACGSDAVKRLPRCGFSAKPDPDGRCQCTACRHGFIISLTPEEIVARVWSARNVRTR